MEEYNDEKTGMISIIIPVFNAEETLNRCLTSVCEQTYKNIEIIIVDDGSTDDTAVIANHFCKNDYRIKYFYQTNKGVSAARNMGLKYVQGEYVGFCDGDDWIDEDMFEHLIINMVASNSDVSIVQLYLERENGVTETPFGNDNLKEIFYPEMALLEMDKGNLFQGHLCNKLIKKSVIQTNCFDEDINICEDSLFLHKILPLAKKIVFENICKYHYVQSRTSAMGKKFSKKYWTRRLAFQRAYEICCNYKYESVLPYIKRLIITSNIVLAKKMGIEKQFDKESYLLLKREILNLLKDNKIPFNNFELLEIRMFVHSYFLFSFYIRMLAIKGR